MRLKRQAQLRQGLWPLRVKQQLTLLSGVDLAPLPVANHLVNDGIERGLWSLRNAADINDPVLAKYKNLNLPPES